MEEKQEGNALKSISKTDDELRVGNYIVLFGGRDLTAFRFLGNTVPRFTNPDGSAGEYFSKSVDLESDYTQLGKLPVNWEHGADPDGLGIGEDDMLGYVDWKTATRDEKGVFVERVLNRRKKYMQWLEELVDAGLVGTSTEPIQKSVQITENGEIVRWGLKRDTLTVTPMEPRMMNDNVLTAYKSLGLIKEVETPSKETQDDISQVEASAAGQEKPEPVATPEIQNVQKSTGVKTMELDETKLQELITQATAEGYKKAIADTEPVEKSASNVQVTLDEADRPFSSLAEQCKAVIAFTTNRTTHPRIKGLKALEAKAIQGASESVPTDGGILLEPTLSPTVLMPVHEEGPFSAGATKLPVASNSNSGWINGVDETSRATGSRWGGIRGYRLAEGDTVTKSKPKFRRVQWELKKYGCLVYDTNELLKDAGQFNTIVQQACREEISFMLNDDILNGAGASGAMGIMNSGALISVTRTDANKIQHADIVSMWARMHPRNKARAAWFINTEAQPQLDALTFTSGSTGILSPYIGYRPDGVMTIYGKPVIQTEFNAALGTTGDILLADMAEYLQWEKGGVEYQTSMHVEFLTDQEVLRFIYRADGQTALASALTPYKGTSTLSPFVCLTTAS